MRHEVQQLGYRFDDWARTEQEHWWRAAAPRNRVQPKPQDAWSLSTWEGAKSRYCLALSWLKDNGGVDWALPPSQRWTGELLNKYVADLEANYPAGTVGGRISGLERALSIMDPEGDRTAVLNVLKTTKKAPFQDQDLTNFPSCDELVSLGIRHCISASGPLDENNFKVLRDGLMLCFVNTLLMRARDTIAIQILSTTHERYAESLRRNYIPKELPPRLAKTEAGNWHVRFIPSKTKRFGQTEWDKEIDGRIVKHLETYLAERKSILKRNGLDHTSLWISYDGTPVDSRTLYRSLTGLTKAAGYPPIASQRTRQIAATKTAEEQPEHMAKVSDDLGHLRLATTTGYNKAGPLSASRRNNDVTSRQMAAARARRRRGRSA